MWSNALMHFEAVTMNLDLQRLETVNMVASNQQLLPYFLIEKQLLFHCHWSQVMEPWESQSYRYWTFLEVWSIKQNSLTILMAHQCIMIIKWSSGKSMRRWENTIFTTDFFRTQHSHHCFHVEPLFSLWLYPCLDRSRYCSSKWQHSLCSELVTQPSPSPSPPHRSLRISNSVFILLARIHSR